MELSIVPDFQACQGELELIEWSAMKALCRVGRLLYEAAVNFDRDHGFDQAATISYFALLSILPLSILLVALGAMLIGSVDMAQRGVQLLLRDIVGLLGPDIFEQARKVGSEASRGAWPFLLISLWTASKVFSKVENSLDHIFRVENRRPFAVRKIFSFGLVALLALLLLVMVVFSGVLTTLDRYLDTTSLAAVKTNPLYDILDNLTTRYVFPWLLTVFTFSFVYKFIPARPVPWRAAGLAGLAAGTLWEVLKNGFTVYVGRFADYAKTYGALETVVIFIIWVNFSAILLLWGGELAALLSGAKGEQSSA
jgi:membrane protein